MCDSEWAMQLSVVMVMVAKQAQAGSAATRAAFSLSERSYEVCMKP